MKPMPCPLPWDQCDASALTTSSLEVTLARAWRFAVPSVKHEAFISNIFVNLIFY